MAVFNPNYGNVYANEASNPYARQQSQGSFYTPPYSQWQYNQPQQNSNSINWVQGRAGAEAYPVAPGASVMLMDSTESVLYVKSADSTGRPMPLKIYDLVERTEAKPVEAKADPIDYDKIRSIIAEEVDSKLKAERSKKGDKH